MAFSMRSFNRIFKYIKVNNLKQNNTSPLKQSLLFASSTVHSSKPLSLSKTVLIIGGLGIGGGIYSYLKEPKEKTKNLGSALTEKTDFTKIDNFPDIKPSREVYGPATDLGLDLTLYQYQTCPFCCKVRAFLEFYGIPYKIIEVNPVMRQQIKFSKYRKVPILLAQEKEAEQRHQLNDSTVIVSILGTLVGNINSGFQTILKYYTPMTYKNDEGKEVDEVMNRYFLMYGDNNPKGRSDEYVKKEREWRKWADKELVHILSPNIYRTYEESVQSFKYFSEVGEWEKNFSKLESLFIIYVGATAMYFIGKKLKKKYSLKPDVRESLYDACRKWTKEIGTQRKFMGGDLPNLADLAVYGLLNSIEGCIAFQDLLDNTNIGKWYYNVKEAVSNHYGYQMLKA